MSQYPTYYQDAEDSFVDLIEKRLAKDGVTATVKHYSGDANSADALEQLMSDVENSPRVLVGVAGKTTEGGASDSRFRQENLRIEVWVATSSHRQKEGPVHKAYPIISSVEQALIGKTGLVYRDPNVKERNAVLGGDFERREDLPHFVVFLLPFTVLVNRALDDDC